MRVEGGSRVERRQMVESQLLGRFLLGHYHARIDHKERL